MLDTHMIMTAPKAKNIGDDSFEKKGGFKEAELRSVPSRSPTGFLPSGHPSGLRTSPWLTGEGIKLP